MHICYVFPHVPKCGGTSMLRHLENSGLRVKIDYEAWNGPRCLELNKRFEEVDISSEYDVIYGHFPIYRYRGPNYRYIALLRDPYERCVSNYKFHRGEAERTRRLDALYDRIGHWVSIGQLSVLEYIAISPGMKTVFKDFMDYWPPSQFAIIGTQERYREFLDRLSDATGITFADNLRERKAVNDVCVPPDEVNRARALLAEEYAWYNSMMRHASADYMPA